LRTVWVFVVCPSKDFIGITCGWLVAETLRPFGYHKGHFGYSC